MVPVVSIAINDHAPMERYSMWQVARHALWGNRNWPRAWRSPYPKRSYDVIIIGGGGHGLATAYYLARNHRLRNIAVLERAWIGGGNTGRNTTLIRSNYLLPQNARFYEWSLKLWEELSSDLNYNVMVSQRGLLNLAHSDAQLDAYARRGNAMRLLGIDAELLSAAEVEKMVPLLDCSGEARYPIFGGLLQPRGGTVRHDAVAWGYARAADRLGVDIIQNCEVTGFKLHGNRVAGVLTNQGTIAADRIGIAVAGNSSHVAAMAGLKLPIESHVLQALVTEPIKPALNAVVTSGAVHCYISQSDKGELVIGGDLDSYNSYAQRGNLPMIEHVVAATVALFPAFSRLRMLRTWGGVMDMTMDGSPIIGSTPVDGLYLNGGWCYGGFKATPASGWVFAHTLANGQPHELNAPFSLDRFSSGLLIDEKGQGPTPNAH
jgi:heterotetrameric sarcosine oxidase beta subunit